MQILTTQGRLFGTALQLAATRGDTDLVLSLLDKSADPVKLGNSHGVVGSRRLFQVDNSEVENTSSEVSRSTPLTCAVHARSRDIVNILLQAIRFRKVSLVCRDTRYDRSLALLAASKFGYLEITQVIFKEGVDSSDMTEALSSTIDAGQEKVMKYLLNRGAQIDFDGLKFAYCRGYMDLVRLYGAQCDPTFATSRRKVSPLFVASIHGQADILRVNSGCWSGY